jgi:hypothetical protein
MARQRKEYRTGGLIEPTNVSPGEDAKECDVEAAGFGTVEGNPNAKMQPGPGGTGSVGSRSSSSARR